MMVRIMKKKYLQLLTVGVLTAAMLAGCGDSSEDADKEKGGVVFEQVAEPVGAPEEEEPAEEMTEEEPVLEDVPPAEGMVRDFFTNEWVNEDQNVKRPLAVMFPIDKEAQPQYGLDHVSVFYEIEEEGKMSRQMGIVENWEGLERIGNIRSIRDYFIYAALEYDPVIIHFGGPELYLYQTPGAVLNRNNRADVENLNGVGGKMGPEAGAFFRVPAGSTSAHTAYTDGEHVAKAMEKEGYQANHRTQYIGEPHFQFAAFNEPNTLEQYADAKEVKEINMAGTYPVTKSALSYNESDGLYYKTLYGNKQVDGASGEQLAFANVIIQSTYSEVRDAKGYLAFQMHDTTRDGYFFTKGRMIHVNWKKTADYEPTRYYDDNGEEVKFNTGKTMIFVAREGVYFEADGEKIEL